MNKLLVITYYWPPAGGVSVLRSLKIVKYLREFGWEPIVYTALNAHYPYYDDGGLKDIPEGVTVLKRPIIEPFILFKFLTGRKKDEALNSIVQIKTKKMGIMDKIGIWIRGNFFIPDARCLWIKPSVSYLKAYLNKNPVTAIFSDGPPHTNTRIAYLLAKSLNVPWLADFQDPWTQADYYQMMMISKLGNLVHSKMEQKVFKQAQKITIASPSWKNDLEGINAKNVDVIYYGYDESDFKGIKEQKSQSTFDIVHTGLLGKDRHPQGFTEILSEIQTSKRIRILLAGQVDIDVLSDMQSAKEIEIKNLGIIPRSESLQLAMNAHLLLLPLNKAQNDKGRIPGKLYEYLRTYNPILGLGNPEGDAAKIIQKCRAGKFYDYHDKKQIKSFLCDMMNGKCNFSPLKEEIYSFSNKNQTRILSKYLNSLSDNISIK